MNNKPIAMMMEVGGGSQREVMLPRRLKFSAPLVLSQASHPTKFRYEHHIHATLNGIDLRSVAAQAHL